MVDVSRRRDGVAIGGELNQLSCNFEASRPGGCCDLPRSRGSSGEVVRSCPEMFCHAADDIVITVLTVLKCTRITSSKL